MKTLLLSVVIPVSMVLGSWFGEWLGYKLWLKKR